MVYFASFQNTLFLAKINCGKTKNKYSILEKDEQL